MTKPDNYFGMLKFLSVILALSFLGGWVPEADAATESKTVQLRAKLARAILKHPRITFLRKQVSGRSDGASAYHNLLGAARGQASKRSSYGNAPGGWKQLDVRMLYGMLRLAESGYSFRVTSIAGGSHSKRSRHYRGTAFDVDTINGVRVGRRGCPYRRFMKRARIYGATEVLGPGSRGHSTHVHAAWPN